MMSLPPLASESKASAAVEGLPTKSIAALHGPLNAAVTRSNASGPAPSIAAIAPAAMAASRCLSFPYRPLPPPCHPSPSRWRRTSAPRRLLRSPAHWPVLNDGAQLLQRGIGCYALSIASVGARRRDRALPKEADISSAGLPADRNSRRRNECRGSTASCRDFHGRRGRPDRRRSRSRDRPGNISPTLRLVSHVRAN